MTPTVIRRCMICGKDFPPRPTGRDRRRICSPECKQSFYRRHFTRHGEARHGQDTPEYIAWLGMKARCLNPRADQFANYGGRGISVCDRWLGSFENFLADMGRRPSVKHSVDRINVNGPYEKHNCRWATLTEQCRNRRRNRLLTFNGATRCLSEWSETLGISVQCIRGRLKAGWSLERALTSPIDISKSHTGGRLRRVGWAYGGGR